MIEYIGEGDKYKVGTGDRIHTIRETAGNIITPAKIATVVSSIATVLAVFIR